ncbi:MAG TPA: hypothetical protein VLC74_02690 [Rhizomicrobium sp.]|nr:hypothetical protein [Rhizomicrobium sp.]
MPSRMDYIDAAMNALRVVLPNEQPIRIVLQEILIAMGLGWLENSDPTPGDLRALDAALARAVAIA